LTGGQFAVFRCFTATAGREAHARGQTSASQEPSPSTQSYVQDKSAAVHTDYIACLRSLSIPIRPLNPSERKRHSAFLHQEVVAKSRRKAWPGNRIGTIDHDVHFIISYPKYHSLAPENINTFADREY
jgi:hypothetical protein